MFIDGQSGRNDLLPLGHKWEHGHGLPVLGRSGVAILLFYWCCSTTMATGDDNDNDNDNDDGARKTTTTTTNDDNGDGATGDGIQ